MRLLFIILLILSLSFSTGPITYGSGTIQDCLNNAYTYCNVTSSSTITDSDFSLINHGLHIQSGVTISLIRSRLSINASEYFINQGYINASATNRDGGSGGSVINHISGGVVTLNGAMNGSNGTSSGNCDSYSLGQGSGFTPFEFTSGSAGAGGATSSGGGFYATGGARTDGGSTCNFASTGGSGQAVRIVSFNITSSGSIESNANTSVAIPGSGGGGGNLASAGGSGGGEVIYYGYLINVSGSINAKGSSGSAGGGYSASGGDGGRVKLCSRSTLSNSSINVSGGSGAGAGSSGSTGVIDSSSNNISCFPNVIIDIFMNNGTNHITNNPATNTITFPLSVGVFNSSNVTCAYIVDGIYTNLGQFNATGFTNSNVSVVGSSAGAHTFGITCGNVSAGITNHTTTITYYVTDVGPYTPPFISINSPTPGSSYINPYPVTLSATVTSALFSSCTSYINNVSIGSFTGSSYSNSYSGYLLIVGTNSFRVTCTYLLGGTNTSSVNFDYISATVSNPFESAFGIDIGTCPLNSYNHLVTQCTEYYKTPSVFNFSAVPCRALNLSLNYSCLSSVSNVTKVGDFYNYTIFYSPSYWNYSGAVGIPNKSLGLTGAEFIYNNKFVTHGGGMQLIDNDSFMYVPAQHKPVDCGYYFTGFYGTYCSYGYGFIVNDRIVMVADNTNQWYTVAGVGISNSSLIPGQPVIYVNVIPLPGVTTNPFSDGIYTRYVCNEQNGTYVINLVNTVEQAYTVFITYNISGVINQTSVSTTSVSLNQNINLTNVVNVSVYDNGGIVCKQQEQGLLFLPFDLFDGSFTDGFGNFFVKMIMLFTVVVSAIIPYMIIITFIFNDVFHILTPNDLGIITAVIAITGIANNIFATEKGIKNMVVVMAIAISYLMLMYTHVQSHIGTEINQITNLFNSITQLVNSSELSDQIIGLGTLMINLVVLILTLPIVVVGLLKMILLFILPTPIFTPLSIVLTLVGYGAVVFYYLKGYEIISNRFRGV